MNLFLKLSASCCDFSWHRLDRQSRRGHSPISCLHCGQTFGTYKPAFLAAPQIVPKLTLCETLSLEGRWTCFPFRETDHSAESPSAISLFESPAICDPKRSRSLLCYRCQTGRPSYRPAGASSIKVVLGGAGQVTIFQPCSLSLQQIIPLGLSENRAYPRVEAVHLFVSNIGGFRETIRFFYRRRRSITGHSRHIHMLRYCSDTSRSARQSD